ncbi:MAG: hypothetical protein OXT67_01085 [Zetaproteobacteria bacterium]|nr:hypothetical protein [Zetaproteobacteria bacterium]
MRLLLKAWITGIALVSTAQLTYGKGDVTWRNMQSDYLYPLGIEDTYNANSYINLVKLYESLLEEIDEKHQLSSPTEIIKKKSELKNAHQWLSFGLQQLKHNSLSEESLEQEKRYHIGRQMLYNLFADFYAGRRLHLDEYIRILGRFITIMPHATEKQLHQIRPSKDEAFPLVRPEKPTQILSPAEIKTMNAYEVAMLDIPQGHHIWHTQQEIETIADPYHNFIQAAENKIQTQLLATGRASLENPFTFAKAQRVVFFDKASLGKTHGRNPKAKVLDTYGVRWKLKWGAESYTESVANYLYLVLGGKHQDINFSIGHNNPILMIFHDEGIDYHHQDPCKRVTNADTLNTCFQGSQYHTTLEPFIIAKGVLTAQDILEMFTDNSSYSESHHADLIGKSYVLFSQASLELREREGIFNRMGSMAQSTLGAENDRAIRGLSVFHMFLDNFDAKDSNGEGLLSRIGDQELQYYEAPTDLGGGFRGSFTRTKGINGYRPNGSLHVWDPFHRGGRYIYTELMAHEPKANRKATAADIFWMTRKIVSQFTNTRLQEAVALSQQPDFVQKSWVYRLQSRRNRYAQLAGISHNYAHPKAPTQRIRLNSEANISCAANKYQLDAELIRTTLINRGFDPTKYIDTPLHEGKINSCKRSIIVYLLYQKYYPVGLGSRPAWMRTKVARPCTFKGPKKQHRYWEHSTTR